MRNFGNIQQMPEFNTSGKFKEVNRFAGYVNLPELVRIWSGVADTVLTKDQTELVKKIPKWREAKRRTSICHRHAHCERDEVCALGT